MQDASRSHSAVADHRHEPRPRRARVSRRLRAIVGAIATATLTAACGLKGSLALPEEPRNVVIRPGPGGEAAPPPTEPEPERLPPPELPPDTRGSNRD